MRLLSGDCYWLASPKQNNKIMYYIYYILFILFLICNSSCSDKQSRIINEDFPRTVKLISEKKSIQEVIRPVGMVIYNDYLIIQNDQIPEAPCFYVYLLDSMRYLYSFARLGNGGNEFVAPLITQCNEAQYFYVFDQVKRKLVGYNLSNSGAQEVTEALIHESTKFPFQELSFINDSVFLYLSVNNEVISYNINCNMVIDTIAFESDLKNKIQGDKPYNKSLDFFHFSNSGGNIVTGHNFINKITINTCDTTGLFKNRNISLTAFTPNYVSSQLYENMYYYMFVEATSDFIFAQYFGYPFKRLQPFPLNMDSRHFDLTLEVYDWSLKKKAIIEFDNDILRCTIDEKRRKIYTWDPLTDFDYILCYDIKEIYEN